MDRLVLPGTMQRRANQAQAKADEEREDISGCAANSLVHHVGHPKGECLHPL